VDLVAAEDTRRTRGLLTHYGISKPLVSLHEHNERREALRLVARLQAGESVAVVTDAGTPGISDPGANLVSLARDAGLRIVPIPGPSAVTAALSASGLSLDAFVFAGFPPATGSPRREWFEAVAGETRAVVLLEAPHRIKRTLSDLAICTKGRRLVVGREISKLFEEFVVCSNAAIAAEAVKPEGEFVVILAPMEADSAGIVANDTADMAIDMIGHITKFGGLQDEDAIAGAAAVFGIPAARLRKLAKKARFARNRELETRE
jgi:16S rRNA (cytidine1402-2'-O)-methyltransferase